MLHGAGDMQIPLREAQECFDSHNGYWTCPWILLSRTTRPQRAISLLSNARAAIEER
jgi:hypothetical protein